MKPQFIIILLAASVAWSAVPALAGDCSMSKRVCRVSHADRFAGAKASPHAVRGVDAHRTQPGKHEQRDSIDAWYRGG
ncbi:MULTISPECIES: hypothetical protein [unclassified Caballeronia]|uniref:hypothetical protein n=1 Tax=unclassified Caballeronia TaxID=2646786 RepID=UPI0028635ECF|nr:MULTISPECIES: hypothetical protein [unclassified Caballeronia]MDR5822965.1 hypothetical protein [Caballeronia sp. LZ043]MDR5881024.1 hypothetical protein [Caballeronia sp. LZ032]